MSTATCEWCGGWIDAVRNHRFPGFCSPACRDLDRARLDAIASDRARRRADARQHRDATDRTKRHHRTTY